MASSTDILTAAAWAFGAALVLQLIVATFGIARRDNSLVDVFWGPTIAVAGWAAAISTGHVSARSWVVLALATIWAARLCWHIGSRHKRSTTEDWRYANWREQWGRLWWVRSLAQVYGFQAVLGTLVAAPLIVTGASSASGDWWWVVIIGVAVWAFGFAFEVVGDAQLGAFLADKQAGRTDAPFMTRGLWGRTRHPNYFGEAALWWGISLAALGAPHGWIGLLGGATVNLLVRYGSGVPVLEKNWRTRDGFADWAEQVPPFLPRMTSPARTADGDVAPRTPRHPTDKEHTR